MSGDRSGETLEYCDNHCHLDDERLPGGPAAAVERARAAGVVRMITVGVDRAHSLRQIDIAAAHDGVWATVGLHPHDAVQGVDTIVDLLGAPKVVAVGECGLDYHYDHSPRDVQRAAFAAQVALAHQHALPLVIHTRDAWADTFDVLDGEGVPERTIFHCFTGGPDEARACLDRGAYLSYSGIVTFKTAEALRDAAALTPIDRLLVETDAPYLAPVPHRGRTNEPAYVPLVAACLADVRAEPLSRVALHSLRNAAVAFGLPQP
jgi:TatD DNase family protein